MKTSEQSLHPRRVRATAILGVLVSAFVAGSVFASDALFSESFETYEAGSNLRGQGGWDGLTNQGTTSEMPVTDGDLLTSGKALNTRAIGEADRIHQIGHALPAFSVDAVTIFSAEVYALADSINTGIGIGGNPSPGPEMATHEGFFAAYRSAWYSTAVGWTFDLRGIAGIDDTNFFAYATGLGKPVTLRIVVDGPARLIYGQLDDGSTTVTTPSRAIDAGQIAELDATAIFSDRSLWDRLGLEVDDIELTASVRTDPTPCGDVNLSGKLTAADALAVLKAAVGQPIVLQCEASGQPLKTGQTACYDAAGAGISCIGSGQDGEYQYGVERVFTDNGDGTISDRATGLMWEKLADDDGVHDVDNVYTWPQAFSAKIATLNSSLFAGFSDWRVPNVAELQTLPNFAAWNPAAFAPFHTACSPGCTTSDCSCTRALPFWTSTSFADTPGLAWTHSAAEGATFTSAKDGYSFRVRAVRSGH